MTEGTTDSGVKVVGASTPDDEGRGRRRNRSPKREERSRGGTDRSVPSRRAFRLVSLVAVLGVIGTLVFGVLYTTKSTAADPTQDPAVVSASRAFLTDFFNFNAKTVDSDFNAVDGMATGAFATQAQQFFNASIRKALEQALAESRGQIRYVAVQSENQGAGTASVYAVVDQTYVNNKITSPQADVVRLVADLKQVNGVWKISDVTVLEGRHPGQHGQRLGLVGLERPRPVGRRSGRRIAVGLRAGLWLKVEASRRQNDPRKATCGR